MISFSRALSLPFSSVSRSIVGILLLLIPGLNILGFLAVLGYGAQIVNTNPRTLAKWDMHTVRHGARFVMGALLLAIVPAVLALIAVILPLNMMTKLEIGLLLLLLYSYIMGSAFIGFSMNHRIIDMFTRSTFAYLFHIDYLMAWALTLCINAAGFLIVAVLREILDNTFASALGWLTPALCILFIAYAIIGWIQLTMSASLYAGVCK